MTINDGGAERLETVAVASGRTSAATAARMRKSEARWANHLRGRGYAVVPRPALEAMLRELGDGPLRGTAYLRGFRDGVLGVAEVSDTAAKRDEALVSGESRG